jgi:hypothetical protein
MSGGAWRMDDESEMTLASIWPTLQLDESGQYEIENLPLFNFNDVGAQFETGTLQSPDILETHPAEKLSPENECSIDDSAKDESQPSTDHIDADVSIKEMHSKGDASNCDVASWNSTKFDKPLSSNDTTRGQHHTLQSSEVLKLLLKNRPSLASCPNAPRSSANQTPKSASLKERHNSTKATNEFESAIPRPLVSAKSNNAHATQARTSESFLIDSLTSSGSLAHRMQSINTNNISNPIRSLSAEFPNNASRNFMKTEAGSVGGIRNDVRSNTEYSYQQTGSKENLAAEQNTLPANHRDILLNSSRVRSSELYSNVADRNCDNQITEDLDILLSELCAQQAMAKSKKSELSGGSERMLWSTCADSCQSPSQRQLAEQSEWLRKNGDLKDKSTNPTMNDKLNSCTNELLRKLFPYSSFRKSQELHGIKQMDDGVPEAIADHDYCQSMTEDLLNRLTEAKKRSCDNSALRSLLLDKNLIEEVRIQAKEDRAKSRRRMMQQMDKCCPPSNKDADLDELNHTSGFCSAVESPGNDAVFLGCTLEISSDDISDRQNLSCSDQNLSWQEQLFDKAEAFDTVNQSNDMLELVSMEHDPALLAATYNYLDYNYNIGDSLLQCISQDQIQLESCEFLSHDDIFLEDKKSFNFDFSEFDADFASKQSKSPGFVEIQKTKKTVHDIRKRKGIKRTVPKRLLKKNHLPWLPHTSNLYCSKVLRTNFTKSSSGSKSKLIHRNISTIAKRKWDHLVVD